MTATAGDPVGVDTERLVGWLKATLEPTLTGIEATRIGGGNSSGAWQLDLRTRCGPHRVVLKAPNNGGLVYECDAAREGGILQAAKKVGAPVPEVLAVDSSGAVLGVPCFVMAHVDGDGVPEDTPASFHGVGWFRDADAADQRTVWWSFIDALADLHAVDWVDVPARYGRDGLADFLGYWRRSLLDAAPAQLVPRQLAVIDWLLAHIPAGADDHPALCMGDARLGNALMTGNAVHTLVDFEVAYIGNPAADVGYCLMHEAFTRRLTDRPATGIPTVDETWEHWEAKTGRAVDDRDYWTAIGATVLCITGTRAMLKWGMPVETIDNDNIVIAEWERIIEQTGASY
ncbi:phosphotransferase family protein [Mycolicibacterium septicum DSM 44393]|uniref:Phosphotransferase family protein n=1 Tax=Mycolicibacterium septicum DSM 44393 TaxID=1341646 RepID=A0A7X6MN05_9MYCO|nr:phosphotransferase family protein [Mycolicibacterium septicum]NKZ11381.1 phosphotransferase family protein [Mycolicibacterium septicum DSM 44393]